MKIHLCKNGDTIAIMSMTDNHLTNTIKMYLNKMLGWANSESIEEILAPYILEAGIRGLNISPYLQKAYARSIRKFVSSDELWLNKDDDSILVAIE